VSEERLQKALARAGVASRRKVEELIREGRVTVNGHLAEIGEKADLDRDAVKVDGKRIQPPRGHRYLLLNKPRGVMSTVSDPEGRPTVIDLVPPALRKALVPVGRLDFNSEGLLLLTDDGEFAQRVAHPSNGSVKTYEVKVKGHPQEGELDRLRGGIVLDGRRTAPCRIRPRRAIGRREESENSWWVVELTEGRTRQIRDMFERVGHPVQKLRRVAIGPLADPGLAPGDLRELTPREVEMLRRKAAAGAGPRPGRDEAVSAASGESSKRPGAATAARPRGAGRGAAASARQPRRRTRATAPDAERPRRPSPAQARESARGKKRTKGPQAARSKAAATSGPRPERGRGSAAPVSRRGGAGAGTAGKRPAGRRPGGSPGSRPAGGPGRSRGSRPSGRPGNSPGSSPGNKGGGGGRRRPS